MSSPGTSNASADASCCSPQCRLVNDALQTKVDLLEAELAGLKTRYDALLQAKEAASARYLADYKKWRDFKIWLFNKNKTDRQSRKGMSSPERKRHVLRAVQANCRKFQENGPRVSRTAHDVNGERKCPVFVLVAFIDAFNIFKLPPPAILSPS